MRDDENGIFELLRLDHFRSAASGRSTLLEGSVRKGVDAVTPFAERSEDVAQRVQFLEDSYVDFGDGVRVSKQCIFDVLPILMNTDDRTRDIFAAEIMMLPPSVVPPLSKDDDLKDLAKHLEYQRGNNLWDKSIHQIIDQGLEITVDDGVIFNPEAILQFLDISEVRKMNRDYSKKQGVIAISQRSTSVASKPAVA